MKCESLIRSRWIPQNGIDPGRWIRYSEPEPCGENAMRYKVRSRSRTQRKGAILKDVALPSGYAWATACLCDKHKRKAVREGNEMVEDKTVQIEEIA